jgi:hypothetical protein
MIGRGSTGETSNRTRRPDEALDWRVLLLRSVIAAWVKGMARMG